MYNLEIKNNKVYFWKRKRGFILVFINDIFLIVSLSFSLSFSCVAFELVLELALVDPLVVDALLVVLLMFRFDLVVLVLATEVESS
jgi:hypothetical protein